MLKKFLDNIKISSGDRIAVGVSGGADSMVLLCLLEELKSKIGFELVAINVNHHLRGSESDRDSLFVENFCKKNKISYKIIDVDVKKIKNEKKLGLEESARLARYDAIFEEMKKQNLNKLCLAHHKNDQVETILMHLFRGTGISGMVGMKQKENILRPLLDISKNEILQYAKKNDIPFVVDSTNLESDCARNFLRNEIMPSLEKNFPAFFENVFEFGKKCKQVDDYLISQINYSLVKIEDNQVVLNGLIFEQNSLLIWYYLKYAFEKIGVFSDVEAKHYELIENLNTLQVNSQISLPHNVIAQKIYSGVKLFKQKEKTQDLQVADFVVGEVKFSKFLIKTEYITLDEVEYGKGSLYVDYYKIPQNAVWRYRKIGDKFAKIGSGSKKLNDYFTDKKIELEQRDLLPVLAYENEILVVAGQDISDKVKVDNSSDTIVKISFQSL